jgi:hypothetical protein
MHLSEGAIEYSEGSYVLYGYGHRIYLISVLTVKGRKDKEKHSWRKTYKKCEPINWPSGRCRRDSCKIIEATTLEATRISRASAPGGGKHRGSG